MAAAASGQLKCLQWARENDCDWDEETCSAAAREGHLECLQWAHQNNCPWSEKTSEGAAEYGHLECLQWAIENGCPWDKDKCRQLTEQKNYPKIVEWIDLITLSDLSSNREVLLMDGTI